MSFKFQANLREHASDRIVAISIQDFLNHTVGEATIILAEVAGIPERQHRQLSQHAVNLAWAGVAGALRGKGFNATSALVAFLSSELADTLDKHDADDDDDTGRLFNVIKPRLVRESVALVSKAVNKLIQEH